MQRLATTALLVISYWATNTISLQAEGPNQPAAVNDILTGFDEAVRKAMKLHSVPGLAIAIVKDDQIVLARGYGVRELGKPEPVTEQTLFAIGSVTKSFTAALAAKLVDDGRLSWDTRVVEHLPQFQLGEAYTTREVRLRDLLAHRCGLDRHEMTWYGREIDRAALIALFPKMKVEHPFRGRFVYNNLLYMAAGELIAKVAQKSWDTCIAEMLFQPLGMTSANTSITRFLASADPTRNVATPHERKRGQPSPVPWLNIDAIGPAGSINASAADMAQYVRFQLSAGRTLDSKRLIKSAVFKEMHKPQIIVGEGAGVVGLLAPEPKLVTYGLGWMISEYAGKKLIEHGGNIDGMSAQVGFLPEEKLGVVVLANSGGSLLPAVLMCDIFDRFLGRPHDPQRVEGTSLLTFLNAYAVTVAGVQYDASKRDKNTTPPSNLDDYTGTYRDDLYGEVKVVKESDGLLLIRNQFRLKMEYWQHQTFRLIDPDGRWPNMGATFVVNPNGIRSEVRLEGLGIDEVAFKRKK